MTACIALFWDGPCVRQHGHAKVVWRQGRVQFLIKKKTAPLVGHQGDEEDQDDVSGEDDGLIYGLIADGFSFDCSRSDLSNR